MHQNGILYNIQRMSVHDGPGIRTTVFFKGCPLRCNWCSNPESQVMKPQLMHFAKLCTNCGACVAVCEHGAVTVHDGIVSRDFKLCTSCGKCAEVCPTDAATVSGATYSADEVMAIVRKDAPFYWNSNGGVTFSGGECSMQEGFLSELIDRCAKEGFHTCVDTCALTSSDFFKVILEKADLFLFDVKHMNSEEHKRLTGVGNEKILYNLQLALSLYPEKIQIRIPLMYSLNDTEENIASLADFLKPYGVKQVDVLPCHTFGSSKYDALHLEQPLLTKYSPGQLHIVAKRFADHGLDIEII